MNSLSELKIFVKLNMTDIIKTYMIHKKAHLFAYTCYDDNISSITQVITQMENLDKELIDSDMQNLRAFNHTYLIITKAVAEQLNQNYFSDDLLMEKFDVRFATYYFNALHEYVYKRIAPPAWIHLFNSCKTNNTYQFIYMALGVNAHVNNDLGQALYDIIPSEEYISDFNKVNILIKNRTSEVISSLYEKSYIVEQSKNKLSFVYTALLYSLIKHWRRNAWDTFLQLKENKTTIEAIEEKALRITQILAIVRKLI